MQSIINPKASNLRLSEAGERIGKVIECREEEEYMSSYYLAVDIGASSGRHILGTVEDGRIKTEEIYRFKNGMEKRDGTLCWDVDTLFKEILEGMKQCAALGKIPVSVSIDTWAVDFVLLDQEERRIGEAVGYRDNRTEGIDREVYKIIPEQELYARTGIQKQPFNTVYQLMALKKQHPGELAQAEALLMIPDYFHFLLSGVKKTEYTNATTTQLVSPRTKDWDWELIEKLGYPKQIFCPIAPAGTELGELLPEVQKAVGYNCKVVLPATHDTGSAVLAVPTTGEDALYISSGTWSLMGVERGEADTSAESRLHNFTNEGGYAYRYRYLKNIMGLWMIQSLKKELKDQYSFAELCDLAEHSRLNSIVDCNDVSFLAPDSMMEAVKAFCSETGQDVPAKPGDYARVIYRSLAVCYRDTAIEIEEITGKHFGKIHIVGGGANADYLNRLTARRTGKAVFAGPSEATAIGNLMVQMLSQNEWKNLIEARACVYRSFRVAEYLPDQESVD